MSSAPAIEISGLVKRYGRITATDALPLRAALGIGLAARLFRWE